MTSSPRAPAHGARVEPAALGGDEHELDVGEAAALRRRRSRTARARARAAARRRSAKQRGAQRRQRVAVDAASPRDSAPAAGRARRRGARSPRCPAGRSSVNDHGLLPSVLTITPNEIGCHIGRHRQHVVDPHRRQIRVRRVEVVVEDRRAHRRIVCTARPPESSRARPRGPARDRHRVDRQQPQQRAAERQRPVEVHAPVREPRDRAAPEPRRRLRQPAGQRRDDERVDVGEPAAQHQSQARSSSPESSETSITSPQKSIRTGACLAEAQRDRAAHRRRELRPQRRAVPHQHVHARRHRSVRELPEPHQRPVVSTTPAHPSSVGRSAGIRVTPRTAGVGGARPRVP